MPRFEDLDVSQKLTATGMSPMVRLSEGSLASYVRVMDDVILPPEFERFAAEAVAAGRYRDTTEVLVAGLDLLRRREQARADLLDPVLAARERADREGCLTGEEVAERVRATIARRARTPA